MLASVCCFKSCFEGAGFNLKAAPPRASDRICLDGRNIGHDVVLIKNLVRLCGAGGVLCTAPLVQNKSYFEVKVLQGGVWGVGVASRKSDLNKPPGGSDAESWVFSSDGIIRHNNVTVHPCGAEIPVEGDVVGITYDHIELNFFLNGKPLEKPITGIRGTVYPALYVDEGAVLDFIPENFIHTQPPGFEPIMIEKSLL
ncbi:hypothetical protein GE061_002331 [Apolygus lucorum]|uniref:Uncharacterized protein n=1 Tax=Apolygus lucorum TaxID=248454 RepID=A0A6A4JB00_APOLU|nr:hypothetical protein GE061_002331 [Apolygus lucorum]